MTFTRPCSTRPRRCATGNCRCDTRREIPRRRKLSPILADLLCAAGHDASHVRNLGMQGATDQAIMAKAEEEQRLVVSADTDLGTLLARSGASLPSVLLIRRLVGRRAAEQAAVILANLPAVAQTWTAEPSLS